jgi:putative ABC transport system permease protein
MTPFPLAEAMKSEFPEVKDYFRYYRALWLQVRTRNNEIMRETEFVFADKSIFRILGIKFISGVPATTPSEVAISRKTAKKYFGDLSPVGQVIPVKFGDGFTPLTVTGVFENFPSGSTLFPSLIADIKLSEMMFTQWQRSLGDYGKLIGTSLDWSRIEFLTYVVVGGNADPVAIAQKLEKYKELLTMEKKDEMHFRLQPVSEIYLGSRELSGNQYIRQGNKDELVYYEVISLMILAISLANYILLTRAGVVGRVINLGTRKAFGASNGDVRKLIIIESVLVVMISLIPATFVIDYGMDMVNSTLNKSLSNEIFMNPFLWVLLIVVVIFTGTLAGWLIGLHYSKIQALELISGNAGKSKSMRWNYSFLVLHFSIYIVLASGVLAVSKQIKFSKSELKGIDPRNVLVADLSSEKLMESYYTLKNEMEKVPGVIAVAGGTIIPPFGGQVPINLATTEGDKIRFDGLIMGEGLVELLGIKVVDGSAFGSFKEGLPEVLINESAARAHKVRAGEKLLAFNVLGVIKDFNAHSMHTEIQPMVILQQNPQRMTQLVIKTDGRNDMIIRESLRQLFKKISPDEIFSMEYLTDRIEEFYEDEKNQESIIGAFTILAAILSIMGLFGISLISISRRRKEIGLRKVNGASAIEVLLLVNSDFLKWVAVAFVIAVPVSIYLLNKWLQRFAYKSELSWWIFAIAGLSSVLIAMLTVSWQSMKAATRNPVEALRYE